jgi:hypothetical protein
MDKDILLSFEEWKARQLGKDREMEMNKSKEAGQQQGFPQQTALSDKAESVPVIDITSPVVIQRDPHTRVPLTDRFNYASLDCSARVHTSHRSAKSPSSILSSKRDRYMLSPCNKKNSKEKHFVVVELCDDIRIDTVQLANFEFFSGVFKEFTVRVAKTYPSNEDGWTVAGTYKAKNVRGVQVCTIRSFQESS